MLIDKSYFLAGPTQVLNVTMGCDTTGANAFVEAYISLYQREFLDRAVGRACAAPLAAYLDSLDDTEGGEPQADPALESVLRKLRTPFADYVFFKLLGENNTQATMTGLVALKSANEHRSPIGRQVQAWNRMANRMNVFAEWVDEGSCPLEGVAIDPALLQTINRFNL